MTEQRCSCKAGWAEIGPLGATCTRGHFGPRNTATGLIELPAPPVTNGHAVMVPSQDEPIWEDEAERIPIDAGEGDLLKIRPLLWQALGSINVPPFVFTRGGALIRLDLAPDEPPRVVDMTQDRMTHSLVRAAHFYGWRPSKDDDGKKTFKKKEVAPPLSFVKDMLAEQVPQVPTLDRVVQAPVFGADGTCATEVGYHASSKTYYAPPNGLVVPYLPHEPTPEDIDKARELILTELMVDFPFVEQADRANAVALGLLPYARDLIPGPTPLHAIEAPTPGSGKTLLARALLSPACGYGLTSLSQSRDEEEWRKSLTSTLRRGATAILLDNVNKLLDSASLSKALTDVVWEDRLLGTNDLAYVPVRCAWVFTGNNPVLSTELARRSVRIRIDPRMDRPQLRAGFRHADLNTWVAEHRGELIWANLVLIRSWVNAGQPRFSDAALGSYEDWSRVIGGILEHAGIHGFLGNLYEFYEASDLDGMVWRGIVDEWWEAHRSAEVGVSQLFSIAQGTEGLDLGNGGERSQKTIFGKALGRQRDRVIGEFRVVQSRTVKHTSLWRLLRVDVMDVDGHSHLSYTRENNDSENTRIAPGCQASECPPTSTMSTQTNESTDEGIEELSF